MDEFVCSLDYTRRESTNDAWNKLNLNSKWSVGCVSELIQSKKWSSKEEWESFYYNSGEERLSLISGNENVLNNFRMSFWQHSKQPDELKSINYYHGRTREDLMEKARVLYDAVKGNGYNLSLDECFECVRFRTICQTWNGIVIAEGKCIDLLRRKFSNYEFRKAEGDVDYDYEVDYEVYYKDKLVLGLQIKPNTYFGNSDYLRDARQINARKFRAYKESRGVEVCVVVYDKKSQSYITNMDKVCSYLTEMK